MASKKKYIKKCMNIFKGKDAPQTERDHLLAGSQPNRTSTVIKMKEFFKDLVIPKKKKEFISEWSEQCKSTDKNFRRFMTKMQFCDACLFIYNLEQNGTEDGSELYKEVAQKMWETVIQALDGDNSQSAGLQSVAVCIRWAKQEKCPSAPDWIPREWQNDLEVLFENYIMKHMPKFVHREMNKGCLVNHLDELKTKLSEIITKLDLLPNDMSASCLTCLCDYMCIHLTSLSDTQLNYEEHVLLYKRAKSLQRRLCKSQYMSEEFDHMLFEKWFQNTGKKIESFGKKKILQALVEILQSEIVWNSYPQPEIQYYFNDVSERAASICKEVEDLGKTLDSTLKSFYLEELIHFVTRYEYFLKEKVDGLISGNGIDIGVRIVKNCSILRVTAKDLGNDCQETEIQRLLGQCENKGTDLMFNALKPEIKEAFQNHFKKNCTNYEYILRRFRGTLQNEDLQNNRMFITLIYHRLVVLYIQSFFKCSTKKSSHISIKEMFLKGSKKLQEFVSNLVPDEDEDSNPLNLITEILTAEDHESLETTTACFAYEHPDLREEHLTTILNIKGNVSSKEKDDLLYYIREKKTVAEENNLRFFEDIQVGYSHSRLKNFLCCLC